MIETSQTIAKIANALVNIQSKLESPKNSKDVKYGNTTFSYVELPVLVNSLRKTLSDHGVVLLQAPFNNDGNIGIETMLIHESGEFIKSTLFSKASTSKPHDIGSLITYYRRYAILSMLSLGQEDDDGQIANEAAKELEKPKTQPKVEQKVNYQKQQQQVLKPIQVAPQLVNQLADSAQKAKIKKLLGDQEYEAYREFIETKMTYEQAEMRIKQMESKNVK